MSRELFLIENGMNKKIMLILCYEYRFFMVKIFPRHLRLKYI
jgi:hypothetical protein